MSTRNTSFQISPDLYKRLNFAAAGLGLSSSEYIRRALITVIAADAMEDPTLKAALQAMNELERQESEESVPA